MGSYPLLLACFVSVSQVAPPSLEGAMQLWDRGEFAAAGDMFAAVARTAPADTRRSAATRAAGAYRKAFESGPKPGAAAHLCSALALLDDVEVAPKLKEQLVALRAPFGPCTRESAPSTEQEPELMAVVPRQRAVPTRGEDNAGPTAALAPRTHEGPTAALAPRTPVEDGEGPTTALAPRTRVDGGEGPTTAPALRTEAARRGPRQPALAWSGLGVLAAGAGGIAVSVGLGMSQATAAAAVPTDLLAQARAAGRPLSAAELAQIDTARGRLDQGLRIARVGAGVSAGLVVAGVIMTAVGWRARASRRFAAGFQGVSVRF